MKDIPNWNKLSVYMKACYGSWIVKSDSVWDAKFVVRVNWTNGHKVKEPYTYPFENRVDAEECLSWWKSNNCDGSIKEV